MSSLGDGSKLRIRSMKAVIFPPALPDDTVVGPRKHQNGNGARPPRRSVAVIEMAVRPVDRCAVVRHPRQQLATGLHPSSRKIPLSRCHRDGGDMFVLTIRLVNRAGDIDRGKWMPPCHFNEMRMPARIGRGVQKRQTDDVVCKLRSCEQVHAAG